jgi:hypothetical protein
VSTVWQIAEMRTALCMAQCMQAGAQFYENVRLQHSTVHAAFGVHLNVNIPGDYDVFMFQGVQELYLKILIKGMGTKSTAIALIC